jgi:GTP cyclohydrolase I
MRSICDEQAEINQGLHQVGPLKYRNVTDPIHSAMEEILGQLGEDPDREGLHDTPQRYAKAMRFLTSGYKVDLKTLVGKAVFNEATNGIVIVRDIEVFSLCEHHLLPFFGRAHVAYLPEGKVIGLSKIPRIVDTYARRLQVQERLTTEVGKALDELLEPRGVAVVIEAAHMCMMMRGVEKQRSITTTSFMHGEFLSSASLRQEFVGLLHRNPAGSL